MNSEPLDFDNDLIRSVSPFVEMGAYEALWDRENASFKTIADLTRISDGKLSKFVPADEIERYSKAVVEKLWQSGVTDFGVRTKHDTLYPHSLLDAAHPLELIYYRGDWDLIHSNSVAVVGSRQASPDGLRRAKKVSRLLAREGYTVASGLARGIDTAAHIGALTEGGRTIAVIGTPIGTYYPAENRGLQEHIERHHLLISQVPVIRYGRQSFKGNRFFFPERNITMSALSKATIIVEAGNTSGTLIQARAAIKQGRQLFIMQSCFENSEITWPARFEEQGAIRVRQFDDILTALRDDG